VDKPSIGSYFNPISKDHSALANFNSLTGLEKLVTVGLTALITLVSLPIFGIGGLVAFRALTFKFKATHIGKDFTTGTDKRTTSIARKEIQSKNTIPTNEAESMSNSEIERIIALDPWLAHEELEFDDMKKVEALIVAACAEEKSQMEGEAIILIRDMQELFPYNYKAGQGNIEKILIKMLLQGKIYYFSHHSKMDPNYAVLLVSGFKIGLRPPSKLEVGDRTKQYYIDLDKVIKQSTIMAPKDTPVDIKSYVERVVDDVNKNLFYRVINKEGFAPMNVLSKVPQEEAKIKALNFLVEKGIIDSWNECEDSDNGYFVKLDKDDKMNTIDRLKSEEWHD
jgi:hypothetical protein